MIILGIDPGAITGLAVIDRKNRSRKIVYLEPVKEDLWRRVEHCLTYWPKFLGLEIPFVNPKRLKLSSLRQQFELIGVFKHRYGSMTSLQIIEISPSQAKAALVPKPTKRKTPITKEEVVEEVQRLYPDIDWSQWNKKETEAICDAISIAEAAYILAD